jgi:hypothetical protein
MVDATPPRNRGASTTTGSVVGYFKVAHYVCHEHTDGKKEV